MDAKRYLFLFPIIIPLLLEAQCPLAGFNAPAAACRNEQLTMVNETTGATSFEWDFCAGDFESTPEAQNIVNSTLLFRTRAIRIIFNNEEWFGFAIDQASSPNRLIRFDFGQSLMNVPAIVDLGNPGNMLNGAYDFRMLKEGNVWYGLVANTGGNNLLRLTFSSGLRQLPVVESLGGFGMLNVPNGIFLVFDNNTLHAFVSNGGAAEIVRLEFGASILATPTVSSFAVSGGNNLRGISIVQECDRWFGLVTSYSSGEVYWLDFVDGIAQAPATGGIAFYDSYFFPASVVINQDGGNYYAFVQSALGPLYKLSFGSSIVDKTGSGTNLGNLGITGETFALEWVKTGSSWIGFSIDLSNRRLARLTIPTPCDASIPTSITENPVVSFADEGTKRITLTAKSNGLSSFVSNDVLVSSSLSPDIDFSSENICTDNDVNFTAINLSEDVSSFEWDFGDATPLSTVENPTHIYSAPGIFSTTLRVIGQNACKNSVSRSLKIYDAPVANFQMPNDVLCTNTDVTFTNVTPDNFDGNLQYRWLVDGIEAGSQRDLVTTFSEIGNKSILLITSIAGCSDDHELISDPVKAGPVVNFSIDGKCENSSVDFTSSLSEPVTSFHWDFDDGSFSNEPAPVHIFSEEGTYTISLAVLSTNGCNNVKEFSLEILDQPEPDFSIEGPPSSCSGYVSSFTDLTPAITDGQLEFWQWNFGDASTENVQHPTHVFQNAGEFIVELTVTSDQGCSNTISKTATILQSPDINFTNSASCLNKTTAFTASSTNGSQFYWEIGTAYYETPSANHVFANAGTHPVKLTVAGSNQCVSVLTRNVVVPESITPAFSVVNNCRGNHAAFTMTTSSDDPITSQLWNFSGEGASTEQDPSFVFFNSGSKNISLQLTTMSGCVYQSQKAIQVIEPPVAQFSFTPPFGVPPQEFSFTNESKDATAFEWDFGDGSISAVASPKHTFSEIGDYIVTLTAKNNIGCEHTTGASISMFAPLPDVDLSLITITPNADGTLKVIVTISNRGNTILKNLPVKVNVSGNVTLETIVSEPIAPFSQYNLVLNYGIAQRSDLEFLCASTTLEGDLHPEGNRICNQLSANLAIITPHPNPVSDYLKVEWIAAGNEVVNIMLLDSSGKKVVETRVESTSGLNEKFMDVRNQRPGIYLLKVTCATASQTHRILVSN